MARPLRIEFPRAIYHVTVRGNAQQDIFLDNKSRQQFLAVLTRKLVSGMTIDLASLASREAKRVGAEALTELLEDTGPLRSIAAACFFRLELAGCGKSPPAAFSHPSEAQSTAQSMIRLFARCGLAGQPFCASCMAVQRRLRPKHP